MDKTKDGKVAKYKESREYQILQILGQ